MQPYPGLPSVTLRYDDGDDDDEAYLKDEAAHHRAAELLNELHPLEPSSTANEAGDRDDSDEAPSQQVLVGNIGDPNGADVMIQSEIIKEPIERSELNIIRDVADPDIHI